MEVSLPSPCVYGVQTSFSIGFRSVELVDSSSSNLYHIRARPQEEDEDMGPND